VELPVGGGSHSLRLRAPGYRDQAVTLELGAGERRDQDVVLEPLQARVEARRIVITEAVYFESGETSIKGESLDVLDDVAQLLRDNVGIRKVEIGGHSDDQGPDDFNLALSQRRMDAVVGYLVAKGVDGERLVPVGYGESRPVEPNDSEEHRALNRRVEFSILEANTAVSPE
jgi:outer membrane protein OmpA-like peptidoglycan-associated protein